MADLTFEQILEWKAEEVTVAFDQQYVYYYDPLETRDALVIAFNAVQNEGAKATIAWLLKQRGCEHFDESEPDYLTDLCDLCMFG